MRYKEYVAKCLAPRACADRVAIKIYIEQLLTKEERFDEDGSLKEITKERAQETLNAFKRRLKEIPKNEWQIIAIVHDKDPASGGWSDATEKPHIHVIIRCIVRDKGGDIMRPRVNTYLNRLGIYYQISDSNPVDLALWKKHGVEYCWHFGEYAIYLLHKSDKAKAAGKEPYKIEEFFGNLTEEEIRQVMEDSVVLDDSGEKVTPRKLAELDETAYKLGYELGDFDAWYGDLPFNVRSCAKMKTVRESYERGINKRLESDEVVSRLCVFVQSPSNMGKTYAARYALQKLGKRYLDASGGDTGKFDNLKVTHDAIIVDDDSCGKHVLNLADTTYTRVYRRNKNNPAWVGDYLIVTSNLSFDAWLYTCGIYDAGQIRAAKSRFYICHLAPVDGTGRNVLECIRPAMRGDDDLSREIDAKYKSFRNYFNASLALYHAKGHKRHVGDRLHELNEYIATPEEIAAYNAAEEEKKQAAARFEADMRAEFEESMEPDEYIEAVMLAMHLAEACA